MKFTDGNFIKKRVNKKCLPGINVATYFGLEFCIKRHEKNENCVSQTSLLNSVLMFRTVV